MLRPSRISRQPGRPAVSAGQLLAAVLAALALGGCGQLGRGTRLVGRSPTPARDVGEVVLPEVRPGEPDRPFAFRATPGHLLYVYFGYASCPDVCPTTLSDLHKALELLGADAARVEVAFVTVDLNRDSAQILVPYLASFVRGGHALRAPNQEQLGHAEAAFAATSTVTKSLQGEIQVSHTALSYLVDERGRIVDQWDFGTSAKDLAHDLRLLLAQTGDSRR